jgi:hypothetical protein
MLGVALDIELPSGVSPGPHRGGITKYRTTALPANLMPISSFHVALGNRELKSATPLV